MATCRRLIERLPSACGRVRVAAALGATGTGLVPRATALASQVSRSDSLFGREGCSPRLDNPVQRALSCDRPVGRVHPKSQQRPPARQSLLDAADRLFYAEGVRAVGIDRITDGAGVAKSSLFYNFAGRTTSSLPISWRATAAGAPSITTPLNTQRGQAPGGLRCPGGGGKPFRLPRMPASQRSRRSGS